MRLVYFDSLKRGNLCSYFQKMIKKSSDWSVISCSKPFKLKQRKHLVVFSGMCIAWIKKIMWESRNTAQWMWKEMWHQKTYHSTNPSRLVTFRNQTNVLCSIHPNDRNSIGPYPTNGRKVVFSEKRKVILDLKYNTYFTL